jgi:hypothetical protein
MNWDSPKSRKKESLQGAKKNEVGRTQDTQAHALSSLWRMRKAG